MNTYFADLHIHIGRSPTGKPIKITGSNYLTIDNILEEASERKGLDIIGVIDSHVPEVLTYLETLLREGQAVELQGGGIKYKHVTLILGTEIELYNASHNGVIHVLCFLPDVKSMQTFSAWLSKYIKNITLSTQRYKGATNALQKKVKSLGGLFIPAHIFTPFKSLYGTGVKDSLTEVFDPSMIDAVELGLSSNTKMADTINELRQYTFVSNSDAHSLKKIGREYQKIKMSEPTFQELVYALHSQYGRRVLVNYGLDPRLGKYHRTSCATCFHHIETGSLQNCPYCGGHRIIKGVYERVLELAINQGDLQAYSERPPYIHQVPLEYIPMLGPKTLNKLLNHFGTEMAIMHRVSKSYLESVVGSEVAKNILLARDGQLPLHEGGAGKYGKVKRKL